MHERVGVDAYLGRHGRAGTRLLLAASPGGHLEELIQIAQQLGAGADSMWVSWRTDQSESLLQNRAHLFLPPVPPRDPRAVVTAIRPMLRHLAHYGRSYSAAVSTGAAIAVAVLPAARAFGIPTTYIESMARVSGPSLTGRVLRTIPGVSLTTQSPSWAVGRWRYRPVLAESYESFRTGDPGSRLRALVTVGTQDKYPFDAMLAAVDRLGITDEQSVWQVGSSQMGVRGDRIGQMSVAEFDETAKRADVVVTHAGVGSLLRLWQLGVYPVVVPRRKVRGEHCDDHQLQIAELARSRDLAVVKEADELTAEDLYYAARRRVRPRTGDRGVVGSARG